MVPPPFGRLSRPRRLTPATAIRAGAIYSAGDTIGCLISDDVRLIRVLGVALLGTLVYAPEINRLFGWIQARHPDHATGRGRLIRAVLAIAWFNPLWIARHDLFIRGFSGRLTGPEVWRGLLVAGLVAFAINLPIALAANYWVQNRVALHHRLYASAAYSATVAVYYALMDSWLA